MEEPSGDTRSFLERLLPEQRIYIKTGDDQTRYFVLSPLSQLGMGVTGLALGAWLLVASSAMVIGMISADDAARQAEVMQEAYENRIAALSRERDQRAKEAGAVQSRFQLALSEIADAQGSLMKLQAERRELVTALGLMRKKFADEVGARDHVEAERDQLSAELQAVVADLDTRLGTETELATTLDTISDALGDTVRQRDDTLLTLTEMEQRLAEIELREKIAADRQERMFQQLEDAVVVALDPLEKLLAASGRNVDNLVEQIREQYSGEGGPMIPASFSGSDEDPVYDRFRALMSDLDRAHLMQIAANQIPFASPVHQSVRFTSGFGQRRDPITGGGRMHNGQDMAGPRGTPILASGDGTVIFAGQQSGYGNVIKIRHAFGYESVYAHLSAIKVKVGDTVSRGDVIGGMGNTGRSTGTHLHYEIRIGGVPVNPMPYMKAARDVF